MSGISFLERLLDGVTVEWKPLGEVAKTYDGTHQTPMYTSSGVPFVSVENIRNLYTTKKFISVDDFEKYKYKPQKDDLFMTRIGDIGTCAVVENDEPLAYYVTLTLIRVDRSSILPKFLKYVIESHIGKSELYKRTLVHATPIKINLGEIGKIIIPIPPLEIQAEIVRILDTFTALTAELTAELGDRQKQYNYYRDRLLTFEEGEVEWKTLLDACDYVDYRGKTPTKTLEGIFLVTAKNIRVGYIDYEASQEFISEDDYASVMRRGLPKLGDVLITTEAPCGFVAQVDRENIALAQRVIKYRSKDKRLSNSFLKYYLLSSHFQNKLLKTATGSTVKGIKGSKLHQLTIPIPSEAEQARIVAILDKFDTLTNSISKGLPREIDLRQQQYEYYRDLLLTFPKPEAVEV
jgi:type I restriction enzyme, S subunit